MKLKRFESLNEDYDQKKGVNRAIDLMEVMKLLKFVAEDEQMTPGNESYSGFLNLRLEDFSSERDTPFKHRLKRNELKKQLPIFLNLYKSDKDFCVRMMRYLGLEVEPNPDEDETIFYSL